MHEPENRTNLNTVLKYEQFSEQRSELRTQTQPRSTGRAPSAIVIIMCCVHYCIAVMTAMHVRFSVFRFSPVKLRFPILGPTTQRPWPVRVLCVEKKPDFTTYHDARHRINATYTRALFLLLKKNAPPQNKQ